MKVLKYFFVKCKISGLNKFKYKINAIKYCINIKIPAILIENKYAVKNEKLRVSNIFILDLLNSFSKILKLK